jgi:hypothetical protein
VGAAVQVVNRNAVGPSQGYGTASDIDTLQSVHMSATCKFCFVDSYVWYFSSALKNLSLFIYDISNMESILL